MKPEILIVDDEEDIRTLIQGILEDEGYRTRLAASSKQALAEVGKAIPDLMVLDIWLQNSDKDGLEILKTVKEKNPNLPVVMISGHGTIETAVTAIKEGAYDFIEKPFKSDRLLLMISRALETAKLRHENQQLREKIDGPIDMIGESSSMSVIKQALSRIAPTNSRVLITGEAGSGKEIAARTLHKLSNRAEGPFLAVNCAILHPERIEVEIFGSEENGKIISGVMEQANGGTLLLDEVADMPLKTQGKILRVLQEQSIQRVGGQDTIEVDVRVMASTNRDLTVAIKEGNFREDLYYRLNVVPLPVPPLRERGKDVGLLAEHFIDLYCKQSGQTKRKLSEGAMAALQGYNWPGNVRQLKNAMEWVMIMGGNTNEPIFKHDLPPEINGTARSENGVDSQTDYLTLSLREAREVFEREYLLSQINRFEGNVSKTAQFVGMERSALHRKLKTLDISSAEKQDGAEEDTAAIRKRA